MKSRILSVGDVKPGPEGNFYIEYTVAYKDGPTITDCAIISNEHQAYLFKKNMEKLIREDVQ